MTQEEKLNTISDKLLRSEKLDDKEIKLMFELYNELFPNRPENSPGCGGCRMRVRTKLLEYLTTVLNMKKITNEIKTIDPHMKQFEKITKTKLKPTDKLKLKEEFRSIVKTIQLFNTHLTFDAHKVKEEEYVNYYNAGFYTLFHIISQEDDNKLIENEITKANIELLEMNDPNITENKPVKKRKYNKKK